MVKDVWKVGSKKEEGKNEKKKNASGIGRRKENVKRKRKS